MSALLFLAVLFLCGRLLKHDPCQVNFIGALIGAGASLIGGALNRSATKKANAANRPVNQVAEWEEAGINPLFGIASGGYIPHQAASIGDAFSEAGRTFADAIDLDHSERVEITRVEEENAELKKKLDEVAKPQEPGHLASHGAILPLPSEGDQNGPQNRNGVPVAGVRADGRQGATGRDLKVTTPYGVVTTDPNWTPTEEIEAEYGEPAAWLYSGLRTMDAFADVVTVPLWNAYSENIGMPFNDWMMSIGDNHGTAKIPDASKQWGGSLPRSIAPTAQEIDNHRYRRNASGGY